MTSSLEIAVPRTVRRQRLSRIAIAAVAYIAANTGVAGAATEVSVIKNLPAYLPGSTVLAGCVVRNAGVAGPGDGAIGSMFLRLVPATGNCKVRASQNSIAGTSTLVLMKDGQVCRSEPVTLSAWQGGASFTLPFSTPPCGPGNYSVIACSNSLPYRKAISNGEFVIGSTVEDCSHYANWSYSGSMFWR